MWDFHNFLARCKFVITDSGGIQEEASALGKPVLVLRNNTERAEGVKTGALKLIGSDESSVYDNIMRLLDNRDLYEKMAAAENPYGDGNASRRIADVIERIM